MYPFVTHTWNTVKGKCHHGCSYCYMKRWGEQKPVRFDEKELKTNLEEGSFIFVGSSCDMWAEKIPSIWIKKTLFHCLVFPRIKYLFQTKNPSRFWEFSLNMPDECILGTTIESNRWYDKMGKSPHPAIRFEKMATLSESGIPVMVTIEPIMDFDVYELSDWIIYIQPEWVNIGADTQKSNLSEPSADKIYKLIEILRNDGLEVKIKDNLKRLLK